MLTKSKEHIESSGSITIYFSKQAMQITFLHTAEAVILDMNLVFQCISLFIA